ncbi:48a2c1cd-0a40-40fd-83a8-7c01a2d9c4f4 [Thermothielavioides terrestris]|uniref:Uncharacterized protein n=2 Tax=Thermothielavioides terrestris TaxID=2587410 RepID=G2QV22_THETT|nr:uncharacterized protein THITE_2086111 [Thermothielavioides terrestris NRRL 8126]AEO64620.1 hypothetical protein THITE_2086111 [Thermothielavioides terrestris NRRL 8126]SPQ26530.1 48a2c1cd-0a40-40fd-83a8-7c01a2d9c4f4 [Thermothielavioides terrestris]
MKPVPRHMAAAMRRATTLKSTHLYPLIPSIMQSPFPHLFSTTTTITNSTPAAQSQPSINSRGKRLDDATHNLKQPPAAAAKAVASGRDETSKTQAQLDEELRQKLEGISGEGGAAGVEYEDGRPVAMKRAVRENMFRYI